MAAGDLLREAAELVDFDRALPYGDANQVYAAVADLWAAYLGRPLTAAEVADMLALMKIGRARFSRNRDHRRDAAGYLALAENSGE